METQLVEGAYYKYSPDNRHCREGYAIACKYTDSEELYLADTFWDANGRSSGLGWRFSDTEKESVEFFFDPTDTETWRPATVNDIIADYEMDDCRTITSQHGHYRQDWVRVGAEHSKRVMLANLQNEIRDAEQKVDSAVRHLCYLSERRALLMKDMTEALNSSAKN